MSTYHPFQPGMRVRIVQDCRGRGPDTGEHGVYEGDYPRSVLIICKGDIIREFAYDLFMDGTIVDSRGTSLVERIQQFELDWDEPAPSLYWTTHTNPKITLDSGRVIWGDECWWEPEEGAGSLEEAQRSLKEFLREMKEVGRRLRQILDEDTEDDDET